LSIVGKGVPKEGFGNERNVEVLFIIQPFQGWDGNYVPRISSVVIQIEDPGTD